MKFTLYKQLDSMDCGPACLRMISKHYGKSLNIQTLRTYSNISRLGVSLLGIAEGAEKIGFRTVGADISLKQLIDAPLPLIAHWQQRHFIVVYKVTNKYVYVADPGGGLLEYNYSEFAKGWAVNLADGDKSGIALLLEPTQDFYLNKDEQDNNQRLGFIRVMQYIKPYRNMVLQIVISLLISSLLQLAFPFLTKSIIDKGINLQDINFITIILIAQLMIIIGRTTAEYIRSWLLLHISVRVNVTIISDFLLKLMKLPQSFFEIKMFGDIMRRIEDHNRIQLFLTSHTIELLFSFVNFIILGLVLFFFNKTIFTVYFISNIIYIMWISIFLSQRRKNDYKQFNLSAREGSLLLQTIQGMQDIKMANAETFSRWKWEKLQAKIFKVSINSLSNSQYQQIGGLFISEGKNILITFFSAKLVLSGNISLGIMLAIQQIIGQLNAPTEQIIGFIHQLQDTKISLERLNEIHQIENEEDISGVTDKHILDKDIIFDNISFSYSGAGLKPILNNLTLIIPNGKKTAIVGSSGSGKTTVLKLLLKFYNPGTGSISIGNSELQSVSHKFWRENTGAVMQDGFIFSDTIANNVAIGEENIDLDKLVESLKISNLYDYVMTLPLGVNTLIGAEGNALSQGQRQRILIARAVYKQPKLLFFDEATNALDTSNEKVIVDNLDAFFKGRTVVVVAHRLSTVKNANQIIVMEEGSVVEVGTHIDLISRKGVYYNLIKNQLELSN